MYLFCNCCEKDTLITPEQYCFVVDLSQSWFRSVNAAYQHVFTTAKSMVLSITYRILIVDDDVSVSSLLRLFFSRRGYDVSLAKDGMEGLAAVREHLPDLIMSDTHMPRMGGIEMVEILRSDQKFATIPIILLTGSVDTAVVKHMTTHFDAVVAKPFHFAQLDQTVTNLLERMKESRR